MRNILVILMVSFLGSAWAAGPGPLLGPGNVGEKDEKGGVKGADAGAGPHRHFNMQLERRADRPEEAFAKEKKAKEEKARREAQAEKSASDPKR